MEERLRRIEAALKALYDLHQCIAPAGGDGCKVCAMMNTLRGGK